MSVLYGEKKEVKQKFGIVVNRNLEFEEKVRLEFGQGTVVPQIRISFKYTKWRENCFNDGCNYTRK